MLMPEGRTGRGLRSGVRLCSAGGVTNRVYDAKRLLLKPYSAYRKRKLGDLDPFLSAAYALHYYRKPMEQFVGVQGMSGRVLLNTFDIDDQAVVMDVGAYVGDWAVAVLDNHNGPTVHSFEPNPRSLEKLEEKAKRYPSLHVHPYGLSDSDATFALTLQGLGSSTFGAGPVADDAKTVDVELRDVVAVMDELGLDHVDVLKVNIEGGEYPLFARLIEQDMLGRFGTIIIQFHEWVPGSYRGRLATRRALRKTHELDWDFNFVWEKWIPKG